MTADHNRQNCDIGGCDICMSYIDLMWLVADENRAKRQAEAADEFERLRAENARLTTENGMLRQDLAETRDLYDQHRQGVTKLALKLADTSHALGRAQALISWIDGACTDQRPHADIEAAITRWKDEQ